MGASLGTPEPRRRASAGKPAEAQSSQAGRREPAPSKMQDEACLVWASCGEAGRLALLGPSQTPGRWRFWIPHPPPAPLPSAIPLWPLLSASQLLWKLGGTLHIKTAALKCAPPIRQLVQTRGAGPLLLVWDPLPKEAFQRETRFTQTLLLAWSSAS